MDFEFNLFLFDQISMQSLTESLLNDIQKYLDIISDNETYIDTIKNQLKDDTLDAKVVNELLSEIEAIEYENSEYRKDIAMLEEVLLREQNEVEDTRSSSPYGDRYDSWDEVFTGGDY